MPSIASRVQTTGSQPDASARLSSDGISRFPAQTDGHDVWESLFVSCLRMIYSIVVALARRHRLCADDAADLASVVRLRIMADDYAILRKFQHRSSLRTYLTVVIRRVFLDEQIAKYGKWRPSQHALRQGSNAVIFERLTTRDGFTFDEACAALETDYRVALPRAALEDLYGRNHRAPVRRLCAPDQFLDEVPAATEAPDEGLMRKERATLGARACASLARAVARLQAQDR